MKMPIRHIKELRLIRCFDGKWVHYGHCYDIIVRKLDRVPIEDIWWVECIVSSFDGRRSVITRMVDVTFEHAVIIARSYINYSLESARKDANNMV